ncbi:MAG: prepilin-type N-terminal cleavage/methylation domain-containing protein [Verrucomicrobia bacterium]|nr:prepilin-type N-terminal cleavage/methylation domain-containing protein [Verrucomicrobiota bacterium]
MKTCDTADSKVCATRRVCPRIAGLSLVEIMVAITLLSVIMIGLFAAFSTTQRALRMSASQTDVLEGARNTMSLLVRDLSEAASTDQPYAINLLVTNPAGPASVFSMPRPGGGAQDNALQDVFFVTRKNDLWTGVGYFVLIRTEGVGTLYRHTSVMAHTPNNDLSKLYGNFTLAQITNSARVAEGLVHLVVRAFDSVGNEYFPPGSTNDIAILPWPTGFVFTNQAMPSYLEVELGMLDPKVYNQFKSMSPAAGVTFLRNQIGKLYLFRQRIPILNHHEP